MSVRLKRDAMELTVDPERGGSVMEWLVDHRPLLTTAHAAGVGAFPLLPFGHRVAQAQFKYGQRLVQLAPTPGFEPHAIHGVGWRCPWQVQSAEAEDLVLQLDHAGEDWPWAFRATQHFTLMESGFVWRLTVENRAASGMPTGLGIHPFFAGSPALRGTFSGRWHTDAQGLPTRLEKLTSPSTNWFAEPVDQSFTGRQGALELRWRDGLGVRIEPSDNLPFTVLYLPADAGFACVEPVSHGLNALNTGEGMIDLAPGEQLAVAVTFRLI